jgi:hypothetical protein
LLDQLDELHFAQVLGALEHHVFEKVGKTCAIGRFHAEADAVVDSGYYRGRGRIGRKNHAQAIRQFVISYWNREGAFCLDGSSEGRNSM